MNSDLKTEKSTAPAINFVMVGDEPKKEATQHGFKAIEPIEIEFVTRRR